MKKLIRAILCCLVAINVFMLTAFAAVPSPEVYTSIDQKSNLCDVKTKYSIGRAQSNARRGTFFDSADVIIRDEGNGNIGASAHANLRKPVTELYVSLYLDRYNKEKDVWQQVDYVDFEYTLEQYPDGIEDPSISVTFTPRKEQARSIVEQAEPALQKVLAQLKAGQEFPPPRDNLYDRFMSGPVNPVFYRFFVKADAFRATDACIGCGKCVELCPPEQYPAGKRQAGLGQTLHPLHGLHLRLPQRGRRVY